ncbi:MAG: DUF362 domain-containing protein [Planctomycetota bacterium]|nr:DUF362 domain-containing protein [Planctomycetota bacterium]
MSHTLDRRAFLGRTAAAGVGAAVLGRRAFGQGGAGGKSVVVKAVRDTAVRDKKPDPKVVREMVHAVVMKLSGTSSPEAAWKTYIKPDDTVGVKINCLFGVGACTHPCVTEAVVEGVRLAGVPPEKIIVWDREDKHMTNSGYKVGKIDGVLYTGVNGDWEDEPTDIHTCKGRLAKILTRKITALVNVPILKTHGLAGVTFSLKNHYGSFHNPREAHGGRGSRKSHGGLCDPFIAEVNALPVIRKKTRLIVADALRPVANGGPQARPRYTYDEKAIMAGLDPVAMDTVGMKMLDAWRTKKDYPSLEETGSAVSIVTAAEKGLGVGDMSKIEIVEA